MHTHFIIIIIIICSIHVRTLLRIRIILSITPTCGKYFVIAHLLSCPLLRSEITH